MHTISWLWAPLAFPPPRRSARSEIRWYGFGSGEREGREEEAAAGRGASWWLVPDSPAPCLLPARKGTGFQGFLLSFSVLEYC
jgi:hypothetical protein